MVRLSEGDTGSTFVVEMSECGHLDSLYDGQHGYLRLYFG